MFTSFSVQQSNMRQFFHFAICVIFVGCVSNTDGSDYNCWHESEQRNATYVNSSTLITNLPTIRLFEGYYPSQSAMQFAAYIYLQEKMGVNVEWYKPENPTDRYPHYFFQDIVNNSADLLFEMWPQPMADASKLNIHTTKFTQNLTLATIANNHNNVYHL